MKSLVPYKFHEDIPANEKCYACKTPKLHFLPNFRGGVGCAYYWYIPVHIIFGKYSMLVSRLLFPSKIKVLYI